MTLAVTLTTLVANKTLVLCIINSCSSQITKDFIKNLIQTLKFILQEQNQQKTNLLTIKVMDEINMIF